MVILIEIEITEMKLDKKVSKGAKIKNRYNQVPHRVIESISFT